MRGDERCRWPLAYPRSVVGHRVLVLVCALALTAAACGSTVPESQRQTALGQRSGTESGLAGGEGLSAGAGANAPGDAGSAGSGGGGATASGRAGGTARGGAGGASGGARAAGAARGVSAAPGVTDSTINVGVLYAVNSGAANAAVGAAGIDQGDGRKNSEIILNDINARGGVAGRKLVPVYHELDNASAETTDAQYQAACENLTKDHKVFVVFGGQTEAFIQCLTNAGVTTIEDNLIRIGDDAFRRYPYHFNIGSMSLDRIAAVQVPALNAQGYFSGWNTATGQPGPGKANIGIVTFDTPAWSHAVDDVLIPGLRRLGFAPSPDNVVRVQEAQRQSDAGALAAATSNAVLRFRSNNVTHVIIFEASAIISLLFANAADSQGYKPRYGANTQTGQQALIDTGAYPRGQLNGTVGIGWLPGLDITPAENPDDGPYSNEPRRRCIDLYRKNGVNYDNANAWSAALSDCNSANFLKQVMDSAPTATRDGFVATANALGTRFESATVLGTRFDANHHDGLGVYRHWAYIPECGCMRYASGNLPVP